MLHVIPPLEKDGKMKFVEIEGGGGNKDPQRGVFYPEGGKDVVPANQPVVDSDTSSDAGTSIADWDPVPRALTRSMTDQRGYRNARMIDGDEMKYGNREVLKRFEPLRLGDKTLTDLSIGGFKVDLSKAAQKAAEVAPLPAAKLPKIFIDPELNFLHHFYQGMERLIGRDVVHNIVSKSEFETECELVLLPLIEDMMRAGYERKDNNLTVFVKSVLTSTFERDERAEPTEKHRGLTVVANLWGFRYIEYGIEMKEADLQMWLRVNYDEFRNRYFDSFKDSGVPAFVTEGVQRRYEKVQRRAAQPVHDPVQSRPPLGSELVLYDETTERIPREKEGRSHRSRRHRSRYYD